MFLTEEQVAMVQRICEKVAGERTRSGEVTIVIRNNMPREVLEKVPIYSGDHLLIGYITNIIPMPLPREEILKRRQRNRRAGKVSGENRSKERE